jgi:hypothetical protein
VESQICSCVFDVPLSRRGTMLSAQKICTVSHDGQDVVYKSELKLSNEEDAPMTMAVDRKVCRDAR